MQQETLGYYYTRGEDGEQRIEVVWDAEACRAFQFNVHRQQASRPLQRAGDDGDTVVPITTRDEAIAAWHRIGAQVAEQERERLVQLRMQDLQDDGYDVISAAQHARGEIEEGGHV